MAQHRFTCGLPFTPQAFGKSIRTEIQRRQFRRRTTDRRVAGAATEVALGGVVIQFAAVAAREQAHHEARRAVAALRTGMIDQRLLRRMQHLAIRQRFHGEDLAPHYRAHRQQAAVHRTVVRAAIGVGLDHCDRAGAAVAVAAAFLGAVQALPLQPAQQGLGGIAAGELNAASVQFKCRRSRGRFRNRCRHRQRVAQHRGCFHAAGPPT